MTQALYRRYRPVTFAEVIGQDHVTTPLRNALAAKRTNHAYLFSGPRGCGKTTSARILARCLNCEQGPTPDPCGVCQSCVDLGPGGGGSLDVIEIDAASHGGVDDARDLRERAHFAPASSRYKVYIIDEAHMVSKEGFNALLKLVEEPPDHVTFVFATTEPDKVIATIRSRTHHYPFRLVPPADLQAHLAAVCAQEKVPVDPAVLSLVVRAGRGSVRDSLSVLDQLLAGAGKDGLTYEGAAGLLGFTPANLVDDTVTAFAAGEGATVFTVVEAVVEAGHDPRRFAEDLLERLRDLIIIQAVPDSAGSILSHLPADELDRMRQQAAHFGPAELSRAADVVNAGLTEMRGATAPRLQLELICARVLLPGADTAERGLAARLDRLERRLAIANESAAGPVAAPSDRRTAGARLEAHAARTEGRAARPLGRASRPEPTAAPPAEPEPRAAGDRPSTPDETPPASAAQVDAQPEAVPGPAPAADPVPGSAGASSDGIDLITLRRHWPDVLAVLAKLKRSTWTLISVNSQIRGVDGDQLTLGFTTKGLRDTFAGASQHQDYLREALIQVLGVEWKIEAIVDPSSGGPALAETAPAAAPASPADPARPSARTQAMAVAAAEAQVADGPPSPADLPSAADPDADDSGLSSHELLERELGAKVIGEYDAS